MEYLLDLLLQLAIAHYYTLTSQHSSLRLYNITKVPTDVGSVTCLGAILLNNCVAQAQILGVAYFLRGQVVLELFSTFCLLSYMLRGEFAFRCGLTPSNNIHWAYAVCSRSYKIKVGHEIILHRSLNKKLVITFGNANVTGHAMVVHPRLKWVSGSDK